MTNYCNIGKLVATFGVKGEVILRHSLGKKTSLKGLEALFIELRKDELVPYFISQTKIKATDEVYLKLEGIETKEEAQKLLQKQVWLTEEEFHRHTAKAAPISLLGFHIIDKGTDIGEILEIIEQPHQLLCRIDWKGKEALSPLHEQFLQKIDKKNKKVMVELPDGLMDVFE
jgi:16S rRNA processing protein RimM